MNARPMVWLSLALLMGCKTEVTFHNQVPNASIQNVRWVTEDGEVFAPESEDVLEPGQKTEPVLIDEDHHGDVGHIEFELVVEGRKVALVTGQEFKAESGENSTFALRPGTTARNMITSAPSGY